MMTPLSTPHALPPLNSQIARLLSGHQQVRPQGLRVQVEQNAVDLEGQVDSWYAKQMAQESIRQIWGMSAL